MLWLCLKVHPGGGWNMGGDMDGAPCVYEAQVFMRRLEKLHPEMLDCSDRKILLSKKMNKYLYDK